MSFKGDYLRVLTPITTDGQILKIDGGQVQYREDHFDIKAKKILEAKNAQLPESLRKIIEVVSVSKAIKPSRAVKAPVQETEEVVETIATETTEKPAPVAKKGRKK